MRGDLYALSGFVILSSAHRTAVVIILLASLVNDGTNSVALELRMARAEQGELSHAGYRSALGSRPIVYVRRHPAKEK